MTEMIFPPIEEWANLGTYDVAVFGAGPGGIAAAISAARLGARTAIIESVGYPGGTAVHANVPNIMGLSRNRRQIVGGIADEFVRKLAAGGYAGIGTDPSTGSLQPVGDEPLLGSVRTTVHAIRTVANDMIRRTGITPHYYTRLIGGLIDGRSVKAAAVDCSEGLGLIRASTFVDATGDAVLLHRCGGATREATPEEAMTKTMIINVGGVKNFDRDTAAARFNELRDAAEVPFPEQTYFMGSAQLNPGEVALNFTLAMGDGLRSAELTRMDIELRDQIDITVAWFRKEFAGFESSYLVDSAARVGVRSGRMIVGRETITQNDIDDDTPVDQPIGYGVRYYGDHGISSFRSSWAKNHNASRPIPWRVLLPKDFDNVAVAGRCISVEPRVVTCVRLIAQCMATGQAAGINAALASQRKVALEAVGYDAVRNVLLKQDAILQL